MSNITYYRLKDGDTIPALSPADFVTRLRKGSRFDGQCTDGEYMEHFARRLEMLDGYRVRTDTADHFLKDLLQCGFVTRIQE